MSNKRNQKRGSGRNQKRNQNGSVSRGGGHPLTTTEAEIHGYLQAGLSTAQIAAKRDCSSSFVRRVKRKLEKLGVVSRLVPGGTMKGGTPRNQRNQKAEPKRNVSGRSSNKKRLHALRFEFGIVSFGPRFKSGMGQHLSDGTWVQCFGDSKLVVSGPKDQDFVGDSADEAIELAYAHWLPVFQRIENDLDVLILKPRKSFRCTYQELATTDAPDAKAVIKRGGHVRIFHPVDGKLRISWDKSKLYEREVHHAKSWYDDDAALDRHMNAITDYGEGPTLPELAKLHSELGGVLQTQMNLMTSYLQSVQPPKQEPLDQRRLDYFG